jgi:FkbM family methyltransferase
VKQLLRKIRNLPIILTPSVWALRSLNRLGVPISSNVYQHFPYQGLINVDVPGGKSFKTISRGTHIENGLYWEGVGSYEKGSLGIWMYLAKQSQTVLDIGANSGVFSLVAWACGSKNVHAFEPIKRVYGRLKSNFESNGMGAPKAWNVAVSNQKGVLEILDPGGDCPVAASLSTEFYDRNHVAEYTKSMVDVIDIDQFCKESGTGAVDLIKLDVEGHELNALLGMINTISSSYPWILMEVYDQYEAELRNFFDTNFNGKYGWYRINENDGDANRNVILVPKSRCPEQLPPQIKQFVFQDGN